MNMDSELVRGGREKVMEPTGACRVREGDRVGLGCGLHFRELRSLCDSGMCERRRAASLG